ncbi:hypothetical protein Q7P37_010997 [Cladosporium fusiforme]
MKFFLATLLVAIMVALAMAAEDLKPVIVSYPKGTPQSELDELKVAIEEAKGIVTHEYNLIGKFALTFLTLASILHRLRRRRAIRMGLAAKVPATFIETIRTMGKDHDVVVEDDKEISINDTPPS